MINMIILWSINNRFMVVFSALLMSAVGLYAVKHTPVDAIPDLSDVQVIIKTTYPGQAPQVVQDQVTYPITTSMLSVPGAKTVRGFSFFGDSYVYVIFDDNTDIYWARSRVLEYLNQASASLPATATTQLGPDASGVGWVYMYALVDKTGQHDISQLRSLQDWFLKYELQSVEGVSEIASVGGMVKQYQIIIDPIKLRAYNIPLAHIEMAVQRANQEIGASVIEMSEAEYMVTVSGYLKNSRDIEHIPLGTNPMGTPLLLKDIAQVQIGPQMRRGISELNGEGEAAGGIVVMRHGENAQQTIYSVKQKLEQLKQGLPKGVEVVTVYDRSTLIKNAVTHLWQTLLKEFLIVALVCIVFLSHLRSSLVAIISLPVAILTAFIVMRIQGINANIMSLGGIAIAIGAMIDGAIVMVENMHKHHEKTPITAENRWQIVAQSASEVGPALFFSLLIITVSFAPVFTLEAQEGRMFNPLSFTKTYAMAAAAILAITLVPVLMGYCVRGKIHSENRNPVSRITRFTYKKCLTCALNYPKTTLVLAGMCLLSTLWPLKHIGSEFMPPLNEGDMMYMPSTYPGISIGKARELLQQTNKMIATVPEVKTVFGKVGRADTATDPAPLTMIETFIQLKPTSQWRNGVTLDSLKRELNNLVVIPGVSNAWVMPIKTRIDMLSTGIKTPIGIKIAGSDLTVIQKIGQDIERLLKNIPETTSVYSERVAGGRYLSVDINRQQAARYGLNIADIQQIISTAVGGKNIAYTVEGLERYPVSVRYPQSYRVTPETISLLPIITPSITPNVTASIAPGSTANKQHIALADVASINIEDGPSIIKSENARINGWVLVDTQSQNISSYVNQAQKIIAQEIQLPAGYSMTWAGQYAYMERAKSKLMVMIPLTLAIIILLLYLSFKRITEVALLMGTLPFAIIGGIWFIYGLGFHFSVAVGVGFIALAGVAVEIGVIMLVYLNQATHTLADKGMVYTNKTNEAVAQKDIEHKGLAHKEGKQHDNEQLKHAIIYGSTQRLRPVLMTTCATILGLLPIMLSDGTGSELMQRLAAPMMGGMASALILVLLVLPVIFFQIKKHRRKIENRK